uniref:Occludin a n=1 Tax=Hucho hucho TaxID=62062 RepID=A0A4W5L781_9TELE
MSSKPNGSPPPYESDGYHEPPQPAYSYYPDDEFQHFYKWTSPPGIIKVMSVIIIVLCVAIFACVASTLAWDSQGAMSGFGGYGGSSYGGSSYGGGGYSGSFGGGAYGAGNNYGYGGLGGNYNDPRTGKGFIIAMAAFSFITALVIFVIVVSRQGLSESRRFYLAVVIICAILALLMLIATIVYLVAVNPMAQSTGSIYGSQLAGLCAQYQGPQVSGMLVNQYLYHYCVVEPQEVSVLCVMIILPVVALSPVNNVSGFPDEGTVLTDYPEKFGGSRSHLDDTSTNYDKPPYNDSPAPPVVCDFPVHSSAPYSSGSEMASSAAGKPKKRRAGRPRRTDGQDTDYASSGDELDDDNDLDSEFPTIANEQERVDYKREFDRDHQEYKDLQGELDIINKSLSEVDRELDDLQEGSPQFLDAMEKYNRLKDIKKSADYQLKKRRCKYLKAKLSHIKRMVADYDRRA